MFDIGSFQARDCQGVTRRAFLRAGAALPFAWGLAGSEKVWAQPKNPRAKSVLLVWLTGGPSHVDLFDPKPDAPAQYRGPFASIDTRTAGARFTELLPRLALRSDRFSVVRTNVNFDGNHRPAGSIGQTGSRPSGGGENVGGSASNYPPNFGSILSRHRGGNELPGFISIARGPVGDCGGAYLGKGGGNWGQRYDPFMVSCSGAGQVSMPALELLDGLSPTRLEDRQHVLKQLDLFRRRVNSAEFEQWDSIFQRASALLTSTEATNAFDLSRESPRTREAFGQTTFGQSCLLGRRLVEAGVPYVQVNWSQLAGVFNANTDYGWDTHADNFGMLADWHGPLFDRVFSALLDDLEERGLLDSTLVVCMGEFGRTPKINYSGSRDHWPGCYFSVWAGGGIKPGRVVGESDPRGEYPATDPTTPAMVGTTMLELAGVDTTARVKMRVLQDGRLIRELL